ncbi:probable adenylate kinase 7, mitochondrial isoform X2 [Neltuma alba]|uniref:probable adenylate kinase 7, mitochondrial isoform X2 n=1 Tax=Neltuma alba TaxID=207710 RepID=UPI0010A35CFF|nr:probable adenylate kinase 7, mitochondrial isoform X2 [Prosopis alba]
MAAISLRRVASPPSLRALGFLSNRAFGSAALAVQYDYDDDEDEYELCGSRAMADSAGWATERGVQWVMIGEPGVKRHVFAERLSKLLEVPHISMGSLLRQELTPRSALYQQIANALNERKLVPEEIIFGLLSRRLEEGYSRGENGFILDGIPRTRIQAEILDQIVHVDLVVNFKCLEENSAKKSQEYIQMSCCGTPSEQLQDEQLKSRWGSSREENFRHLGEQSKPLEDYYCKQEKLINFEVAGGPGETWQGLLAALHLQHINANSSTQKLTA